MVKITYPNPIIGTFFRIKNRYFQFIHKIKKTVQSDLIVQPYDRNKSCQKSHLKQH